MRWPVSVFIVALVYLLTGVVGFAYHFREISAPDGIGIELTEFLAFVAGRVSAFRAELGAMAGRRLDCVSCGAEYLEFVEPGSGACGDVRADCLGFVSAPGGWLFSESERMKLVLLVLAAGTLCAQTTPLEVASIRLAEPGNMKGVRGGCHGVDSKSGEGNGDIPLGRCVISDGRLGHMIFIAWHLKTMTMIQNAPDWVIGTDERYNLQAKAENPKATEAELYGMLQQVLVDRFQLKYHREDHDENGYALVVAKGGPKMETSKDGDVTRLGPVQQGELPGGYDFGEAILDGRTDFISLQFRTRQREGRDRA